MRTRMLLREAKVRVAGIVILCLIAATAGSGASAQPAEPGQVDTSNVTTWQVIADPEYHTLWRSSEAEKNSNTNNANSSESEFFKLLRTTLNAELDKNSENVLPTSAKDLVSVGHHNNMSIGLRLPDEADLNSEGVRYNTSEVIHQGKNSVQIEVAKIENKGTRIITIIDSSMAPTTYTYPLILPANVSVKSSYDSGSALLIKTDKNGNTVPVGYITAPWAYDATGRVVQVSQIVSQNTISLRVNHQGSAYPVYADPTYYSISCTLGAHKKFTVEQYLTTKGVCPEINFYDYKNYWPVGTKLKNKHRTVKQHGECSWMVDAIYPIFDFSVPCKAHDYCYDLKRLSYSKVNQLNCDLVFFSDLDKSCLITVGGHTIPFISSLNRPCFQVARAVKGFVLGNTSLQELLNIISKFT